MQTPTDDVVFVGAGPTGSPPSAMPVGDGGAREASERSADDFDVVICGGGLAGLCLARQLRRDLAAISVAVIEPTRRPLPEACHKVGESSVELGSTYLCRLGLGEYLRDRHLIKNGLRFFPGGGATLPLEQRTEIGPVRSPLVTSYQIDRGRLENDLRAMVQADGAALFEGASVCGLELGRDGEAHAVDMVDGEQTRRLRARWVVDATGRGALIRPKLKLTRKVDHAASSSWFRVPQRIDIADLVPAAEADWHARDPEHKRWLSTVHLMGDGYWLWIIPLSSGYTSIGVVVHDTVHEYETIATLDATMAWIAKHEPVLAERLHGIEVADFLSLRTFSSGATRAWSTDRWATVGEASGFGDPLYSPGTDFIAFANVFTVEAIRADLGEADFAGRVEQINMFYRALSAGALETVRRAAPVYGHASAMAVKLYWDNLSYWSYSCQYFIQEIYKLPVVEQAAYSTIGARFVELHGYVQRLVSTWATLAPVEPAGGFIDVPSFPSILVDAHTDLLERWTPAQTLARMRQRLGEAEEVVSELVLRVVSHLGPQLGEQLIRETGLSRWKLGFSAQRMAIDEKTGRTRRKLLSAVARDVDRSLAVVHPHQNAAAARGVLESHVMSAG